MPNNHRSSCVLVIDANPTGCFIMCESIRERIPHLTLRHTTDAAASFAVLRSSEVLAVVCHHCRTLDQEELVRALRSVDPHVAIVATADVDRLTALLNAGATAFVRYGAWTSIAESVGNVVERMEHPPVDLSGPAGHLRVVVAHQDNAVRSKVREHLRAHVAVGVIQEAEDETDMIQVVRTFQPDFALIDVAMANSAHNVLAANSISRGTFAAFLLGLP